jgi:hypothetical protein
MSVAVQLCVSWCLPVLLAKEGYFSWLLLLIDCLLLLLDCLLLCFGFVFKSQTHATTCHRVRWNELRVEFKKNLAEPTGS